MEKKDEQIFFDYEDANKFNLLLAVDEKEVLYYKINEFSTDSKNFLDFIKELNVTLLKKKYNNYVLILDNLSAHKTSELIEYYSNNNINVIFNAPYASYFNAIELAFRVIKKIYGTLFSSSNSLKNKVIEILSSEEFKKSLKNNYAQTLNEYIKFYESIKDKNLNQLYK